jgi:hypothetical protein
MSNSLRPSLLHMLNMEAAGSFETFTKLHAVKCREVVILMVSLLVY